MYFKVMMDDFARFTRVTRDGTVMTPSYLQDFDVYSAYCLFSRCEESANAKKQIITANGTNLKNPSLSLTKSWERESHLYFRLGDRTG